MNHTIHVDIVLRNFANDSFANSSKELIGISYLNSLSYEKDLRVAESDCESS